jgi:hypothetical protein
MNKDINLSSTCPKRAYHKPHTKTGYETSLKRYPNNLKLTEIGDYSPSIKPFNETLKSAVQGDSRRFEGLKSLEKNA